MTVIKHNPASLFSPYRCYSHATEIRGGSRLLFVSGLNGYRTYLADPRYDEANVRLRVKYLGTHQPASTVVCCQLLDPRWKLEVEAVAAKALP